MSTNANPAAVPGLAIRFDGPPSHESGRFVEVEIDGVSVKVGEWKQQGEFWLLVLGPTYAAAPELLKALHALISGSGPTEGGGSAPCWCSKPWKELNADHSRACQLARVATEKATVSA